jgi:REP element-mobilizing transposase RayT
MPDHLHLLVELGDAEPLAALMRRVKSVTGRVARESGASRGGATWMRGYHERFVRDGPGREAAARYIVANPVRAGLVGSCREYPYWDAIWLD